MPTRSSELLWCVLAAFLAFGLPFGFVEYVLPNYSGTYVAFETGPSWNDVILRALVMTVLGIAIGVLPLAAIKQLFRITALSTGTVVGAVWFAAMVLLLFFANDQSVWWRSYFAIAFVGALVGGGVAGIIVLRHIDLRGESH
jgi:hypothetical protein